MQAQVIRGHGEIDDITFEANWPDPVAGSGRGGVAGRRLLAELPRPLHLARHARHQARHAADHGHRRRRRSGRHRPRRDRLEHRRPGHGRSDQSQARQASGRGDGRRPGRTGQGGGGAADPPAGRRLVRSRGGAAGRLRHGLSDDGRARQDRARREGADPRRLGRRRHVLRAARQAGRRARGRRRVERGQAGAPEGARRRRRHQLQERRLHEGGASPLRQAEVLRRRRAAWTSWSTSPGARPGCRRCAACATTGACSPAARPRASTRRKTSATSGPSSSTSSARTAGCPRTSRRCSRWCAAASSCP